MNFGKYLRGKDQHVGTSRTEKDIMEKKEFITLTYSVGPAPDGDGAVLTFKNGSGMTAITLPECHVNQLITLLRAVVPNE